MSTSINFEYPLNERIRTFLRLEHLYERLDLFAPRDEPQSTRVAIDALLDLIAISARADVKNEILKELDRHVGTLTRLSRQRGVDPTALEHVMNDLDMAMNAIRELAGPIGQSAREDEFLKSIAQRSSIPGGTCSFDLPQFHVWLLQPQEVRQARIDHWLRDISPAIDAILLALSLVRTSASSRMVQAEAGFFQEALEPLAPAQMLVVGLDAADALYPEISGHKNRFSIRLMQIDPNGRASQHTEDLSFKLTCCVF